MREWEPGIATGLLFVVCLVLAGWGVLRLLEDWQLRPRGRRNWWTVVFVCGAVVLLLGCAAALFVYGG